MADSPDDSNAPVSADGGTENVAEKAVETAAENTAENTVENASSSESNPSDESDTSQTEDAVMKSMMQFFADELLPVFGISKKVKYLAPTEQIHIEIKKGLQDFNMFMEDDSITHFEFQSTNGGTNDLRRFRTYESTASYQFGRPVTTYVLFSGNIKRPMTKITEGINTYRIVPIIMRNKNADTILKKLRKKLDAGAALTRKDLAVLPLLPIMGGRLSIKERIQAAFKITANAIHVSKEDINRIDAAIYAMATKFLSKTDLKDITEEVKMGIFTEIIEDGRKEGLERGRREGREEGLAEGRKKGLMEGREKGLMEGRAEGRAEFLTEQVEKKLKRGMPIAEIAIALEQDEETVRQVAAGLNISGQSGSDLRQ